jgi:hypothetical protein
MQGLADSKLLALWERGAARHALDRSALLAAVARPDWPADSVVDQPLGAVNASLLRLREACFGHRIDSHTDCPRCGQRLSFALDTRTLLQDAPDVSAGWVDTEVTAGRRVRPASLRDLAAAANESDAGRAARVLLDRCTLAGDNAPADDAAAASVEAALEALDPLADLTLNLQCPDCGHTGDARLDPGALLWDELEASAQSLLAEVHHLACAYGWSEDQVLALSPARRARYLAMVGAP